MVDRWPWKKRHIPFLLAHVGIIVTLAGSLITRYWGVDGSMSFGIGEKSRQVTVGEKEIMVLGSFDGQKWRPKPLIFFCTHPVRIQLFCNLGKIQ
jgi:hypothetical protein